MWALFDFVCEGRLLGTSRTFKQQYEDPIVRVSNRLLELRINTPKDIDFYNTGSDRSALQPAQVTRYL